MSTKALSLQAISKHIVSKTKERYTNHVMRTSYVRIETVAKKNKKIIWKTYTTQKCILNLQ